MTKVPTSEADMTAYKAAQKKRNLYIGGALLAFVVLVFIISIVRMSEGLRHDREHRAHPMSNLPATSAGASVS
jgi:hypothetical protein